MTLRAAVIGAAGFLGAAICAGLRQAGHDVVPVLRGDPLPQGRFDLVVDCAGDSRRYFCNTQPLHAFAANVTSVLERVVGIEADLFVLASSVDVYGSGKSSTETSAETAEIIAPALDGYSFTKAMAELVVRRHAKQALILRLGTLIGPGLRKNPVFDVLNDLPLRIAETSILSLVDVRFVSQALLTLLEAQARGIFNVTGRGVVHASNILDMVKRHHPDKTVSFHPDREEFRYHVAVDSLMTFLDVPTGLEMLDHFMAEHGGERGRA